MMHKILIFFIMCFAYGCAAFYEPDGPGSVQENWDADLLKVNGEAFFPVGIYGGSDPAFYPLLKEYGFNTVIGGPSSARIDAAEANGLMYCASLHNHTEKVETYNSSSNINYWYLYDEPYFGNLTGDDMAVFYNQVKAVDSRPVFMVISPWGPVENYMSSYDILGLDHYPIPGYSVIEVYKAISFANIMTGFSKPIFYVVQAFPWPGMRPPAPGELRAMVYLAVVNNVKGIFYFAFKFREWELPDNLELWNEIKACNHELDGIKDYLNKGSIRSVVECNNANVKFICREFDGKYLIVLVNSQNGIEDAVLNFFGRDFRQFEDLGSGVVGEIFGNVMRIKLDSYESGLILIL